MKIANVQHAAVDIMSRVIDGSVKWLGFKSPTSRESPLTEGIDQRQVVNEGGEPGIEKPVGLIRAGLQVIELFNCW